jgi:hypothetical protein
MDNIGIFQQSLKKAATSLMSKAPTRSAMPIMTKAPMVKPMVNNKLSQLAKKTIAKNTPMLIKTPVGIKKLTPITKTANLPSTSNAMKPNVVMTPASASSIKSFEQSLQSMPASKAAKTIFNAPITPALVNTLDPVQRSFLRTDLPYNRVPTQKPRLTRLKNTPFVLRSDIDAIQPPVDGGTGNYYGK